MPKESATQPGVGEIRLDRLDADAMLGSELDCQLFHRFERPRHEDEVGAPVGESFGVGAPKPQEAPVINA
ncbi:MAG TPA: hypothetical protein VGF61_24175 [Candidatus Acidoferrum sp.]